MGLGEEGDGRIDRRGTKECLGDGNVLHLDCDVLVQTPLTIHLKGVHFILFSLNKVFLLKNML